ncbi:MAG TPA: hypothetical protein DIS72_02525, partial [Staphylococcus sp.]|nr:hypothetical protein [Staphylococcus sp.]
DNTSEDTTDVVNSDNTGSQDVTNQDTTEAVQDTEDNTSEDTSDVVNSDNTASQDVTNQDSTEAVQDTEDNTSEDASDVVDSDETTSQDVTNQDSTETVQDTEDNTSEDTSDVVDSDESASQDVEEQDGSEVAQDTEDNTSEDTSDVVDSGETTSQDVDDQDSTEAVQDTEDSTSEDTSDVVDSDESASQDVEDQDSSEVAQDTEDNTSEDTTDVVDSDETTSQDVEDQDNTKGVQDTEDNTSEDTSDVVDSDESASQDVEDQDGSEVAQDTEDNTSEDTTDVVDSDETSSQDVDDQDSSEVAQDTEENTSDDEYNFDFDDQDDTSNDIESNSIDNNQNVQLESANVKPQVRTFAARSARSIPTSTYRSTYNAAVSSTINNQIRSNNYGVPNYVEDFSSHIPKIPYRNGVGKPEGVIAHETANPNSTIHGEIAYMKNNYENAFVHAFVDDNNIIEVAPTDYLAWGAGGVANQRFIHVELVRVYGGDRFARSINNYADYIATNLAYYGLPFDSAEYDGNGTLWSHDAVSKYLGGTNHSDPYGWFAENNYTFNELVDLVHEKYQYKTGTLTAPSKPIVTKPKPTKPVVKPTPKPTKPVVTKPKPTKPVVGTAKTVAVNYKGKVNINASGVYSSVYDTTTKPATNKAGKTFNIGKQSTFNNQVFYLLQDNNGTPLGWVKSSDIQLQTVTKPTPKPVVKPTTKPVAKPATKPVAKPTTKPVAKPATKPVAKPATKPVAKPATKPVAKPATKPVAKPATRPVAKPTTKPVAKPTTKPVAKTVRVNYVGKVNNNISGIYTSVYDQKTVPAMNKAGRTFKIGKQSTYNNQTYYLLQDNNAIPLGWVKANDVQLQTNRVQPKPVKQVTPAQPKKTNAIKSNVVNNQPMNLKENYTNYLIFDNTGYFYSQPNVSKSTLLGSLQNYQYAYFKVISSQKVGNELWYKGLLNGKTVWINSKYLQLATEATNISTSPYTLDQAVDIQMALRNGSEPKKVLPSGIRNATRAEVKDAMDTSKYVNDPVQKYQFLDLNKSQNISPSKLNELLRGKGILENQGNAFSQASKAVGINEIYLISHALLETGNGTSQLANGGNIDKNGKVDLNSKTKYYNMFGVGAIDKNALYGGIKYAQQAGWNTPEKAIFGGAQFIANNYIKAGQNTLYKMRFNPQKPGVHQYATGVDFSKSNAKRISDFYQQIQTDGQFYDVDQYKS